MNFSDQMPSVPVTQARFTQERDVLLSYLQTLSVEQCQSLLGVSEALAQLNYERFTHFYAEQTPERAAIFAYYGDVYAAFDAYSLDQAALERTQERLCIISALYGPLRPFDLIRPYRLEMDAPLKRYADLSQTLSAYWQAVVQEAVMVQMAACRADFLLNLASDQYFSVMAGAPIRVVKPIFEEYRQGAYKQISFLMKKARGMMLRYIMSHNVSDYAGLTAFAEAGYVFEEKASSPTELVFRRALNE